MKCNHNTITHSSMKCQLKLVYCGTKVLSLSCSPGVVSTIHNIEMFEDRKDLPARMVELGLDVDYLVAKEAVKFGLKLKITKKRKR